MFPLDVGIRRIYLDRAEWLKATQGLRRRILFWRGVPRPPEAEESLGALLARRDQVRSRQPTPVLQADSRLFEPQKQSAVLEASPAAIESPPEEVGSSPPTNQEEMSTASRLLAAKKKAREREKH